ncbi:MAG: AI-2E family transporter [Oligoflexia bacterium]|nr:AI-2E family transporter [Oligoflexia bacterium]MBF0366121.1 AI-2E family transporter [Oligoflexia bacterium]
MQKSQQSHPQPPQHHKYTPPLTKKRVFSPLRRFNDRRSRMIFFVALSACFLALLIALPRISIPLAIAYVVALIIEQISPLLTKIGIPKPIAITIIVTVAFLVCSYPVIRAIPILSSEIERIQTYIPKIDNTIRTYYETIKDEVLARTGVDLGDKNLSTNIASVVANESKNILLKLPNYLAYFLEWSLLTPFFLFFILRDGRNAKFTFLKLVPNMIFERSYYLWSQFNKQLGEYIFAKFIEAFIIGAITTAGLLIFDVPFAILLGIAAAITNIIPYIGPFLGVIPAIIVCTIEYGLFSSATGAVMLLYIIANVIDMSIVFPILVSKIVNIHPIVVILSVILGSQYMGIVGMVISIPVAAIAKLIFAEIYKELYPVSSRQNE